MCGMVIDAEWIHSIDASCHGGSCECGAMLGGCGSEPRGSRQCKLTFMIFFISRRHHTRNPSLTILRWSGWTISDVSGKAASDCSRGSEVRSAQHSICAEVMAR